MSAAPDAGPRRVAELVMHCRPDVRVVSTIRRLTTEFCRHYVGDAEVASRIGMATHELFENAVKYAGNGRAGLKVTVTRDGETMEVDVVTTNRASDENIIRVERLVDLLDRANLKHSYRSMLHASVNEPQRFGLGLPRVVAEAEMRLHCEAGEDDIQVGATVAVAAP